MVFPSLLFFTKSICFKIRNWCEIADWVISRVCAMSHTHIGSPSMAKRIFILVLSPSILKKSERMALKLVLNRLRINRGFTLTPGDIEIHINHNKADNMLVKAEVLQILLACGVHYKRAIKTIDLFSDPEQVALESAKRMDILYPEEEKEPVIQTQQKEVVE